MYPRLKEFVKTIMSPEFQTVMTFLKVIPEDEDLEDKLQYAKTGIMKLNKVLGVEDYEFHTEDNIENEQIKNDYYDDSLISSLLLIKRSKLEDVVKKIVQYQQKSKQKDLDSLSSKIIFELTNKKLSYQRLNYLTRRAKSKVSSRTVPSFKNSSKLVCRGSVRSKFTSRNVVKTQINSNILDKILSKSPQNSLKSIDEDCKSEYYACNIDDTKHLESESVSVSCADSLGTFNTTPKNLNKLTINQIKQF